MSVTSLFYYQDQYAKACPRRSRFVWNISGAKTAALIIPQSGVLSTFDAIASQAVIDGFFGSTNEILLDKYDATAMGTDAFGVLLNFNGQLQSIVLVEGYTSTSTGGATLVNRVTQAAGLTASTLQTAAVCTSSGNAGLKFIFTSVDGLTSGQIVVDVSWISK